MNITFTMFGYKSAVFDSKIKRAIKTDMFSNGLKTNTVKTIIAAQAKFEALKMGERTRIINDPSYLVPLLRTFSSRTHKKVFDLLLSNWMTQEELDEAIEAESLSSLINLKKAGLLESKWRVPEPGKSPVKEYHTSYSNVQVNFQSSFEDLSDIIMLAFKPYEEVKDTIESLERMVAEGNNSMSKLTRELNMNTSHICAIARRSDRLSVMGQRLKLVEKDEEI